MVIWGTVSDVINKLIFDIVTICLNVELFIITVVLCCSGNFS